MKTIHMALCGVLVMALALTMSLPVRGTPFTWGEGVAPLRWPPNKKITVWVPPSVFMGVDRAPFVREGISRWIPIMMNRGITINVPNMPPQPTTPNLVPVNFQAAGTSLAMDAGKKGAPTLAAGYPEGLAGCTGPEGGNLTTGEIILLNTLPATTAAQQEYLRNLAAHEMCHVLGLADDAAGTVTAKTHGTTAEGFNAQDLREIGTLYPVIGQPAPQGQVQPGGGFVGGDMFLYDFIYTGPPDGHVPLIVFDIDASVIDTVLCPPGWVCLDPRDPLAKDLGHPYYADYMTSCSSNRAPWKSGVRVPLAFRALTPAVELSPLNPMISLGLIAVDYQVGPVPVWSGDTLQFPPGPVPLECAADIVPPPNGDGEVNVDDLLAVINAWGPCANPNDCPADIAPIGPPQGNDVVDVDDLLGVINAWGACP